MAPISYNTPLMQKAGEIAQEFEYDTKQINAAVEEFQNLMTKGVENEGEAMTMIPTYVTAVPNGTEKGVYLALDLGGTNFRVCSVTLHGNSKFALNQAKSAIPRELMTGTAQGLFSFLASKVGDFVREHHSEHFEEDNEHHLRLGFTFSFPVDQKGINKGFLIRWTKGFDIKDAIGKDVCQLLQEEIDKLGLPVVVAALVNDTVGTLMARSYTSPGKARTLIGAIFGTGTNGAYVEKLANIKKMTATTEAQEAYGHYNTSTGEMVVNTEWGSFDNELRVLPDTPYDRALDANTFNPGIQMFEKRVSGMFLGEILRNAIVALKDSNVGLFAQEGIVINENPNLYRPWTIDTSFLSLVEADQSEGFATSRELMETELGVSGASEQDVEAVRTIARAIGRRSARLSAVPLAAICIRTVLAEEHAHASVTESLAKLSKMIDIGVDGSVVEYYPGFEKYLREALREVDTCGLGELEPRISIGVAKDGSGVGAALIALVATL
ncbi:hexokinase-domain-containing protein [Tirmania nivea]|nr:hexokinase-domain-containing protein [Tirmania nivea]